MRKEQTGLCLAGRNRKVNQERIFVELVFQLRSKIWKNLDTSGCIQWPYMEIQSLNSLCCIAGITYSCYV